MQNIINMKTIASKVHQNIRINEEDALWLYQYANLGELGNLANAVNLRKNGKAVFYNVNRHINPTNICALSCKFCAYSKKPGEAGGYAYEIDEMITKAGEAIAQGATELHMVGGLHPRWGFQRYVDMIAALRKAYPDIHLKAFTAVEIDWMARKARKSIGQVIEELRNAGLNSFPGGGAEIFHPEIRDAICDTKVSGEQWIDTHRTAHGLGMRSNCTMLYGHIERYEHRVDHMRRLRELQDETAGFNVFIPLSFQPFQNEMGVDRYTFGSDDLRNIAVARLYLDNFKHIKSYWVMLGQDIAQLALSFGANDLDGTVLEEKISKAAGGRSGMIMTRGNLESLIRRSGRIPVERTTLYEPVNESDRAYLQPASEITNPLAAELLNRIKNDSVLSAHETWQLASTATLNDLIQAVEDRRAQDLVPKPFTFSETIHVDAAEFTETASFDQHLQLKFAELAAGSLSHDSSSISITVDISTHPTLSFDLRDIVGAIHRVAPQSAIVLKGANNIYQTWKLFGGSLTLSEYLFDLTHRGVRGFTSTTGDMSTDVGIKRLEELSLLAIAMDMRVTLALPLTSKDQGPDWSQFASDLVTIRTLSQKLKYCLTVEVSKHHDDCTLMPSEFMKALGLARLSLENHVEIHAPIFSIPTLAPAKGLGADITQHAAMKMISTLRCFGANGIGSLPLGEVHVERIYGDLRATALIPTLSNIQNQRIDLRDDKLAVLSGLRHVPFAENEDVILVTSDSHSKIKRQTNRLESMVSVSS